MSAVVFAVDQAACIRCGACVLTCPPGAVSVQGLSGPGSGGWGDRRLTVDPGRCSACWACTEICPTDAIAPEGAP